MSFSLIALRLGVNSFQQGLDPPAGSEQREDSVRCSMRLCGRPARRLLRCVSTECGQRCCEGRSYHCCDYRVDKRPDLTAYQEGRPCEYHHVEDEERDSCDCCCP